MGEPRLMTQEEYFAAWKTYNPLGRKYYELEKMLLVISIAIAINGIIAAHAYGTDHSRSGPLLVFVFIAMTASCWLGCLILRRCQRSKYQLWLKYYPYSSDLEFSKKDFERTF